jgi:hypothetical protein
MSAKQREALGVINPDGGGGSSARGDVDPPANVSTVAVDAGREEIPPTYDSLPFEERRP